MKKNLNHSFASLWTFVLAFTLLLSGCGAGAGTTQSTEGSTEPVGQGTEESPEPAGQDTKESWRPTAPVNLIVSYAAGGGTDIFARTVAKYIDLDGQTMYVTNIEGGGSTIGAMEAYHSDNDGLTLYTNSIETTAATYFGGTLPENLCEEMTWIASLADEPLMVSVAADSPYESLKDLINAAKADPGSLTIAGVISISSVKGAVLDIQRSLGVEFTIVPYDSAAKARAAVLGGHESLLFGQLSDIKANVDSGELRILAVEAEERYELAPDVPTFKELGYDGLIYGISRCYMLPPGTNEEIARYYNAKIKEVFDNEEFQSVVRDTVGIGLSFTGIDDMGDKVTETLERIEKYVQLATE